MKVGKKFFGIGVNFFVVVNFSTIIGKTGLLLLFFVDVNNFLVTRSIKSVSFSIIIIHYQARESKYYYCLLPFRELTLHKYKHSCASQQKREESTQLHTPFHSTIVHSGVYLFLLFENVKTLELHYFDIYIIVKCLHTYSYYSVCIGKYPPISSSGSSSMRISAIFFMERIFKLSRTITSWE